MFRYNQCFVICIHLFLVCSGYNKSDFLLCASQRRHNPCFYQIIFTSEVYTMYACLCNSDGGHHDVFCRCKIIRHVVDANVIISPNNEVPNLSIPLNRSCHSSSGSNLKINAERFTKSNNTIKL